MVKAHEWSVSVRVTGSTLASVNAYWGPPNVLYFFGLDDEGRPFSVKMSLAEIEVLRHLLEMAIHAEKTGRVLVLEERLHIEMPLTPGAVQDGEDHGRGAEDPSTGAQRP